MKKTLSHRREQVRFLLQNGETVHRIRVAIGLRDPELLKRALDHIPTSEIKKYLEFIYYPRDLEPYLLAYVQQRHLVRVEIKQCCAVM